MEIGSLVRVKHGACAGTLCRVTDCGKDENGKTWVEVVPTEFNSIAREFPEEYLEEVKE